jgi:anti-anti-sigma regulatory factor
MLRDVLWMSLASDVSDQQATRVIEDVIDHVAVKGAKGVVVDVSEAALLDSDICSMVVSLAAVAWLLGIPSWVYGLSVEATTRLERMGISFDDSERGHGLARFGGSELPS